MSKSYDYHADGRLRFVDDAANGKFDRLNAYDHQGRIHQAKSSSEANGGTTSRSRRPPIAATRSTAGSA